MDNKYSFDINQVITKFDMGCNLHDYCHSVRFINKENVKINKKITGYDEDDIDDIDQATIKMYSDSFIEYLRENINIIYSEKEREIVRGIICCLNAYSMYDYEESFSDLETRTEIRDLFESVHFYSGPYIGLRKKLFSNKEPITINSDGSIERLMGFIIYYFDLDDNAMLYRKRRGKLDIVKYVMKKKYNIYDDYNSLTSQKELVEESNILLKTVQSV